MNIIFHELARQELDEAEAYYNRERPGLGDEFTDDVESAVERIRQSPDRWQRVGRSTRRCRTHRFRYGLVYEIRGDTIVIFAVMHLHRTPGYWKGRLKWTPAEP